MTPPHLIRCRFQDTIIIPYSVSDTAIVCRTPKHPSTATMNVTGHWYPEDPSIINGTRCGHAMNMSTQCSAGSPMNRFCGGIVSLAVSNNNQQYQILPSMGVPANTQFTYTEWPCRLIGLHPAQGPESGGININVTGRFFQRLPEQKKKLV